MNDQKRLQKLYASRENVRFSDLVRLLEAFGFRHLRTTGSHHIFARPGMVEQLNVQDRGGKAKAYQVDQFLKLIEKYNLELG